MNADRLARWYRWIEYCAFGRQLERSRFRLLDRITGAEHLLILGEGDGRTLVRVLEAAPGACIDVVEMSPRMIALARQRIADSSRVRFLCEDARLVRLPEQHYDALITCYFLDCFAEDDVAALAASLARALKPGAPWLVAEFTIPEKGWHRWHASAWIWVMYRFFRVATGLRVQALAPFAKILQASGLTRIESHRAFAGMIVAELWRKL